MKLVSHLMKGTKVLTLGAVSVYTPVFSRLRIRMRKFVGVYNYSVNTRAVQIRS